MMGNIATDRLTEDADFGKKKSSFQMKPILILAVMYTNKIEASGAQKTHTHILKSQRTLNESLFGADFGPEAKLSHFSSKLSKKKPLQSMAIVIEPC